MCVYFYLVSLDLYFMLFTTVAHVTMYVHRLFNRKMKHSDNIQQFIVAILQRSQISECSTPFKNTLAMQFQ